MMTRISIIVCFTLLAGAAHATEIYRGVDVNGRTQISDTVPARYKDTATKVDTNPSEISEAQHQEAIQRAAADKREADAKIAKRIQQEKEALSEKMAADNTPSVSDENDHCEQLIKAYKESQECFAHYIIRRRDGRPHRPVRVREEAYHYCRSVPDPSAQCGLLIPH